MSLFKHAFLKLDPQAAPIIWRLAKPDRRLGLRYPLTLAILSAAMTSAVGIAYVASLPEVLRTARFMGGSYRFHWNVFDFLGSASLALLLITPTVIAALTAILVSRDSHSEAWVLIRTTNLTRRPVYQGYVMSALYRLRLLLAISFGLLPLITFGAAGLLLRQKTTRTVPILNEAYWPYDVILFGVVCVILWGLNWIAVLWGAGCGLRLREPVLAGALASGAIMISGVMFVVTAIVVPAVILYLVIQYDAELALFVSAPMICLILMAIALIPYAIFIHEMKIDGPLPDRRLR